MVRQSALSVSSSTADSQTWYERVSFSHESTSRLVGRLDRPKIQSAVNTGIRSGPDSRQNHGSCTRLVSASDREAPPYTLAPVCLATNRVAVYLAILFVSKDALLLVSGIVLRVRTLRRENISLSNLLNPAISSVEIRPLLISKANTALQFLVLALSLAPVTIPDTILSVIQYMNTLWSPCLTHFKDLCRHHHHNHGHFPSLSVSPGRAPD